MADVTLPAGLDGTRGADGFIELRVEDPVAPLQALTSWSIDHHVALDGLEVLRPSLEDVYLLLTGDAAGSHTAPASSIPETSQP